MEQVGVVGLGLLGASFALSLRVNVRDVGLVGVDPSKEVRERAMERGAVDVVHASIEAARADLARCNLVLLASPIAAIEASIGPVSAAMRPGAVLTDVGGVKGCVVEVARARCAKSVSFVAAHPMFGGPEGGIERARADLWRGGVVYVCDDVGGTDAIERVASLHGALGARVVRGSAHAHDRACAVVSHAPYLLAHALRALADADPIAAEIAGPGFARAVHSANFPFEIQGDVARRNPELRPTIDALIDRLTELRDAFASSDAAARAAVARR
jgi:prephenate dehydrogenase